MTIHETLRKLVNEGMTPDQAADAALNRARKIDLVAYVRPLVVMKARQLQRGNTRTIEHEVDARIADGEDPLSVRRKLSQSHFSLPDSTYVEWLGATAEQHLARAGWLRLQADTTVATAERHEAAAAAIRAAGVTCLRDLEAAA